MDSNVTTQSTPALPLEQVFQDFIEVAVLLNMINPGKLFGDSRPLGHDNEIRTPEPWHRFKDEFAWLGDIRKGGGSVTAVAGVMMSGQRTLLLASNYGVKPKVSRHLRDVLQTLQSLARSGAESQSKAQRQILESSVDLSWDKIKNYSDRLSRLITWLSAHSEAPDSEADLALHDGLARLHAFAGNHLAVCEASYEFSKGNLRDCLDEKCEIEPEVEIFHRIRHYVGRLGSWHRASTFLVEIAVDLPELVAGLTLYVIPQHALACRLSTVADGALENLVAKLQLDLNTDHVLGKLQSLYTKIYRTQEERSADIRTGFVEKMKDRNLKPLVHPEVLIADYVFRGNLSFIRDDRYIGCSKPSCITCHLYLEDHPANILPRLCHGNLWPKWCPPYFASEGHSQHMSGLVQNITRQFRRVILDRLMDGRTITMRFPDSVTGITRSGKY